MRLLQRDDLQQCRVLVADRHSYAAANVAFTFELQARGFRLLQRDDLQKCCVLVADSASGAVPADLVVPSKAAAEYHMPRFSPVSSSSKHASNILA